jgi:hypothetical protein
MFHVCDSSKGGLLGGTVRPMYNGVANVSYVRLPVCIGSGLAAHIAGCEGRSEGGFLRTLTSRHRALCASAVAPSLGIETGAGPARGSIGKWGLVGAAPGDGSRSRYGWDNNLEQGKLRIRSMLVDSGAQPSFPTTPKPLAHHCPNPSTSTDSESGHGRSGSSDGAQQRERETRRDIRGSRLPDPSCPS